MRLVRAAVGGAVTSAPAPVGQGGQAADADLGSLLWRAALGLLVVASAAIGLGIAFREPVIAAARVFVEATGGWAVAVAYFVPIFLVVPMPLEAVTTFALLGGVPFWEAAAWGCIGTLAAGPVGFAAGRRLAQMPKIATLLATRGARAQAVIARHGWIALALAAMIPAPYAWFVWAAGALGMRWRTFLLVSLLRVPRVVLYLWFAELGTAAIAG